MVIFESDINSIYTIREHSRELFWEENTVYTVIFELIELIEFIVKTLKKSSNRLPRKYI